MKRFLAYRTLDISATHNHTQVNPPDEIQYEGVVFDNGKCVLNWRTEINSISVWDSFQDAMNIHGHPEYGTRIVFLDGPLPLPWECYKPNCLGIKEPGFDHCQHHFVDANRATSHE